jgi:hypothetical protein
MSQTVCLPGIYDDSEGIENGNMRLYHDLLSGQISDAVRFAQGPCCCLLPAKKTRRYRQISFRNKILHVPIFYIFQAPMFGY